MATVGLTRKAKPPFADVMTLPPLLIWTIASAAGEPSPLTTLPDTIALPPGRTEAGAWTAANEPPTDFASCVAFSSPSTTYSGLWTPPERSLCHDL